MKTVLLTGGTGFIGKELSKALEEKGYRVLIFTRSAAKYAAGTATIRYASWNPLNGTLDETALSEADYIIHLAGAPVAEKRWTVRRKKEITESRVQGGSLIAAALERVPNKVRAVISAAAIGWYGPDKAVQGIEKKFSETDPPAPGFIGDSCRQWEESIQPVRKTGKRLVIFRSGIVLHRSGGMLKRFLGPLRMGLAPVLGNGRQVISWIHMEDMVAMYLKALEDESMEGVYNAVAPNPVTNRTFVLTLARMRRKFFLPVRVPAFLLKIALGEMSTEVFKSATVSADKILGTGFQFRYSHIGDALAGL